MKKNLYLLLFIVGVLIIGVPQTRILMNEFHSASQLQTNMKMVEAYPVQDLTLYTEQIESANSRETIEEPNQEMVINDPFETEVAPDALPVSSAVFSEDMVGYITIPKIGEQLPIFNGATNEHLAMGAATVVGTSLPVGGDSTHAVISGHRGYAGANYFRHLDLLVPGDKILITVLNKLLTYEVTGSQVVEPKDASSLGVESGKDLLTLLTCHPFMVNDKRLLVHAERVVNAPGSAPFIPSVTAIEQPASTTETQYENELPHSANSTQIVETTTQSNQVNEQPTTNIVKSLVNVTFKFNSELITKSVKKDLLINRIIVLLSFIAILGAGGLLIRNLIKSVKK